MSQAGRPYTALLGLAFAGYGFSRFLELVPSNLPRTPIVALDVLSAMTFALVDGTRHYGWRGILVFSAICLVIGNVIENIGIATGIPYGHYQFIELMGPKFLNVPVLLGLAYIGMAYVSWTLARIIVGGVSASGGRLPMMALPLVASFIMVAWDLAQDPVWATILQGWRWRDGGSWFGVPASNYFGWYLTVSLIYVAFELCLRRGLVAPLDVTSSAWWPAVAFYGLCALGNVMQVFAPSAPAMVQDAAGRWWRAADITGASALVSVFVMGAFLVLAGVKLAQQRVPATAKPQ